ncbi:MAG TPA: hypothetical protein VHD76_07200 [Bryobacteraceae bacterium]|nr:hypothetical protein [Bryobacteraceae bacterium]
MKVLDDIATALPAGLTAESDFAAEPATEEIAPPVPSTAKRICLKGAAIRLYPAFQDVFRLPHALSRDRAFVGLIVAIYGPTPFGGANTVKDVALRYGITEQHLHALIGKALRSLQAAAASAVPPPEVMPDFHRLAPSGEPPAAVARRPAEPEGGDLPELLRKPCLQDAARRLSPTLLNVAQEGTLKARDRSLAALMTLLYGPAFFRGGITLREVAARYLMTESHFQMLIATHRELLVG